MTESQSFVSLDRLLAASRESVVQQLIDEPYEFDFFQAVRLLELASCYSPAGRSDPLARPVGYDFAPSRESIRFRATPSQSFASCEIAALAPGNPGAASRSAHTPLEMDVAFLGLTGPSGVLPQHYTQRLIDELREDVGMREFFDIFNQRLVSHFYRVWKKQHFAISYEAQARSNELTKDRPSARQPGDDTFTFGLYCLAGMGSAGLRGRQEIPDEGLLRFAGLFVQHPRNAVSLERMVSDYFGLPTRIEQFCGQWLWLEATNQTSLSTGLGSDSANSCLGQSAIAGQRIWDIESQFRVSVGPLNYGDFWEFTPGGTQLTALSQLVRSYIGPELEFEVCPVLQREEVPPCQLDSGNATGPHLGWNTWLCSQPLDSDASNATFPVEGAPLL